MRFFRHIATALLLGLVSISCQEKTPDPEPKPDTSNDKSIVIIYDNDVHCSIDGYSKLAGYRDAAADTAYVATVSCGDFLQGGAVGSFSKGEFIVDIMNAVGYDAVTLGNHEFDYKAPRLFELMKKLKTTVTCVNFVDIKTSQPFYAPYMIKQMGKKKVAFVGAITPSTINKESYAFYDQDQNQLYDLQDDNLNRLIQAAVNDARKQGADYVILLSHLGELDDSCHSNSMTVIAGTTGIDAVLDGHTHSLITEQKVKNAAGEDVLLTQTGTKLANIGKLTISRSGKIMSECIPTASITQESKAVKEAIDKVNGECDAIMSKVLTHSDFDLSITDKSGRRTVRKEETNIGDLIADAIRSATGAQIAFVNGGGISKGMPAGDITWRNVYDSQSFANTISIIKATGQQIIDHLELCSNSCPYENGSFMQVSGLKYKITTTNSTGSIWINRNTYEIIVENQRKVSNVQVLGDDGKYHTINPMQFYTIGTINFIADTHTTFPTFTISEHIADEIMSDTECLGMYLESLGGSVPEIYREPQGRITIR